MQPFKFQVSLMCLRGRIKAAFADAFAIGHDLNAPFSLVRGHTQKPGLIGFSGLAHILQIAKSRNFAQIVKSVVLLVAVFMIDMLFGKLACYIQPRQSVRKAFLVVDGNCPVTGVGWAARTFTDKIRSVMMLFPHKLARVRVVVQDGSDMVSGNHDIQFTIGRAKCTPQF